LTRAWSSFLSLDLGLRERFDANNPPLVLDENSAKSSSRTRFCEGFHGGDFYDSHSFFLSQSGENFVEIESDDDDAIE
jgi:hypothetical protein